MIPALHSTGIAHTNTSMTCELLLDQANIDLPIFSSSNSWSNFVTHYTQEDVETLKDLEKKMHVLYHSVQQQQNLGYGLGKCFRAFVSRFSEKISPALCKKAQKIDLEWLWIKVFDVCLSTPCRKIFKSIPMRLSITVAKESQMEFQRELQKETDVRLFDESTAKTYELLDQTIWEHPLSMNSWSDYVTNYISKGVESFSQLKKKIGEIKDALKEQQRVGRAAGKCLRAFVSSAYEKVTSSVCEVAQGLDLDWFEFKVNRQCGIERTCRRIFKTSIAELYAINVNVYDRISSTQEELQKKTDVILFDRSTPPMEKEFPVPGSFLDIDFE